MIFNLKHVWQAVDSMPSRRRNYEKDLKDWELCLMETQIKTYEQAVDIVLKEARSWIGVPFHHQGRTKRGCDCIAIGMACAKSLEMEFNDWTQYGRVPHGGKLEKSISEHMISIDIKDIAPGDGVLITWKTEPHHAGIITQMGTGELGILHSYQSIGYVVEHHLDQKWKKRIILAYRFPILDKLLKESKK